MRPQWGGGKGTRLQHKRLGGLDKKHEKALRDCNTLIKEIEKWIVENKENDILCIESIHEGSIKFKKRIARVSQEALIRLVDRKVVDHLAYLQIKIESLRKRAEREDKRRSHQSRGSSSINEEIVGNTDEVFHEMDPIQGIQSLSGDSNIMDRPFTTVESPPLLEPIRTNTENLERPDLENPIDLDYSDSTLPDFKSPSPPLIIDNLTPPPFV